MNVAMKTSIKMLALVLFPVAAISSPIYNTNFSAEGGYSPGPLAGQGGGVWTTSAGKNFSITAPVGTHPATSQGDNLLFVSPRTDGISGQAALLTFAPDDDRVLHNFRISYEIYASPHGGGDSLFVHIANGLHPSRVNALQFHLRTVDSSSFRVLPRDNGTWLLTAEYTLPKDTWLRMEVEIVATPGQSTGTYGLDANGDIVYTYFEQSNDEYGFWFPGDSFDTMQILAGSTRTDYWIDNILSGTASESYHAPDGCAVLLRDEVYAPPQSWRPVITKNTFIDATGGEWAGGVGHSGSIDNRYPVLIDATSANVTTINGFMNGDLNQEVPWSTPALMSIRRRCLFGISPGLRRC